MLEMRKWRLRSYNLRCDQSCFLEIRRNSRNFISCFFLADGLGILKEIVIEKIN